MDYPNNFETALREEEEKLVEARRYAAEYKALYDRWMSETAICFRVVQRMRAAAGLETTPVLQIEAEPARPAPQPKPQPLEVPAARRADPFPVVVQGVPNGFDRFAAQRACRAWRIGYPLARSYQHASAFERQAVMRTLANHDRYREWIELGGKSVTIGGTQPKAVQKEVAEYLGIDLHAVRRSAREIWEVIMSYGQRGVDYK